MKTWKDYIEKAEQILCVEKIREEIRNMLNNVQVVIVEDIYNTHDFPFIQANIRTPWQGKLYKVIYAIEEGEWDTEKCEKDPLILSSLELSDIEKKAFQLFINDNIENIVEKLSKPLKRHSTLLNKKLFLKIGTIKNHEIFILIAKFTVDED